jgi:Zn-dependent protease with chaperone function
MRAAGCCRSPGNGVKLENRIPAEGINASHESPLREFAWLLGGSIALLVAAVTVVSYSAQWLAPRIPYRYEAKLAAGLDLAPPAQDAAARAAQAELQALADRLAARMGLPEGMQVRVGYRDQRTVNAFATLGGQTVFFRGLVQRLGSEDALAMVMAHELAHLKHRHPAAALGRGVAVGLLLSVVSADLGRSAAGGALGQAGMLTLLSFNRDQEREADAEALRVVAAEYDHIGGALDLFAAFTAVQGERAGSNLPRIEFLQTHPLTAARIAAVKAWAHENRVALDGPRRPLPPALAAIRVSSSSAQ